MNGEFRQAEETMMGEVFYSNLMQLPGISAQEKEAFHMCNLIRRFNGNISYIAILLCIEGDLLRPIAHVDFKSIEENRELAFCSDGQISFNVNKYDVPYYLKGIRYGSNFVQGGTALGLEVAEKYQKRGLGGLVWALGLSLLKSQGVTKVRVTQDSTYDRKTRKSFYVRYGGKRDPETGRVEVSTTPTVEQQELITKALTPRS